MFLRNVYNQLVYKVYRPYFKQIPLFESLAYLFKYRLMPYSLGKGVPRYKAPTWKVTNDKNYETIKIAIICDEMTWQNFRGQYELVFLTPQNWFTELERVKPDLFFCESTWAGNDENYGCWNYRILHNRRLLIENRIALLKILKYCQKAIIPTIFWNKEDPTFFDDEVNNFVDTALLFDHIFTTASECAQFYERKGHRSVHTMMFGFSPRLFYPIKNNQKCHLAVFFGSWYSDQPQRCEDMNKIFDMVLNQGLKLVIYDRQSGKGNENNLFPDKYKQYLHQGIHYSEIRNKLQEAQFVININTVKDSQTMFARRVFEMMACGKIIISNYSSGLERLFGKKRIWYLGESFDFSHLDEIIWNNIKDVFLNHTWKVRLEQMFHIIEFELTRKVPKVRLIYYIADSKAECYSKHFDSVSYNLKQCLLFNGSVFTDPVTQESYTSNMLVEEVGWFIEVDPNIPLTDIDFMVSLSSFAHEDLAISHNGEAYTFGVDKYNFNCLIPMKMISNWSVNKSIEIKKFYI